MSLTLDLGTLSLAGLLSGGRRYILSIGDEAVVLTLLHRGKVENAWVAASEPSDGAADILGALAGHKSAPVSVLMDAFEQVFREEKVPRVGILDQKKVIGRHLHMAFPGNNLQAAIPNGQDPQGNHFYLFASVPPTDQVKGWLDVLKRAGRAPAGIHMLPLESLDMLKALTPSEATSHVRWRMLFTFNMTGGLRQIIAKQSRIVLTRLTPPPSADGDVHPADIIARDYQQTLSYVKRMGYQRGDHLDLVILAEEPLAGALRNREWEAHSLTVLSPREAGTPLGLGPVGQSGTPYADVLHAAFLGAKKIPRLSLRWAQAPAVDYRQSLIKGAPVAAGVAVLGLAAAVASVTMDGWETEDLIAHEQTSLTAAQRGLEAAREKLATLEEDPVEVRRVIDIVDRITQGDVAPVPLFARLNEALAGQARVTEMTLKEETLDTSRGGERRRQNEPKPLALSLSLALPDGVRTDEDAVARANTLRDALAKVFGADRVSLTRPPVDIGADQVLRGGLGQAVPGTPVSETAQAYSATYRIVMEDAS